MANDCLDRAGLSAAQVDTILCVSTPGLSTPSLDARLMDRVAFRPDVERLPVFGLGCAGGTLGLARAGSGIVRVFDANPWRDAATLHRRIAAVPGDVSLWPNLTGGEAIDYLARLRGAHTRHPEYRAERARLQEEQRRSLAEVRTLLTD